MDKYIRKSDYLQVVYAGLTAYRNDVTIYMYLYLKSFLLYKGGIYMKKRKYNVMLLILLAVVCLFLRFYEIRKSTPVASITVDEMTPLSLELIYQGEKPQGVGSVQSMAITDDYFIIAGRPVGSSSEGGEENNKLIVIDRDDLLDVTASFLDSNETFELGHANGMAYNPNSDELAVVGIRNEDGFCDGVCYVDAKDFKTRSTMKLPCDGNGIAYDDLRNRYYLRDGGCYYVLDSQLSEVIESGPAITDLTNQDISYYNDKIYFVNWAYHLEDAIAVGILTNQNVIYQLDLKDDTMRAFVVRKPRMEMESIDFKDGVAYVLFNGGGTKNGSYFIYRAQFASSDLE